MAKTVSLRVAILAVVVATIAGVGIGAWLRRSGNEQLARDLSLAYDLDMGGMCAKGLTLNAVQDGDRLSKLLEMRLESTLQHIPHLLDEGASLEIAAPNMKESLARAADYYTSKGDNGKAESVQALLARLEGAR